MLNPLHGRRFVWAVARPLLATALALGAVAPAAAAVDLFLNIDTIPGESPDQEHRDWIVGLRYDHELANERSPGPSAATSGRVACGPLVVTKTIDKATPKLYEACAKGTHLPTAVLELVRAGERQQAYFKLLLQDVVISHVSTGASRGAEPTETITINYSRMDINYRPQKPDGSLDTPIHISVDCPAKN